MTAGARQTPPRASASSSHSAAMPSARCPRVWERVARLSRRATVGPEKWSPPFGIRRAGQNSAYRCVQIWAAHPRGWAARLLPMAKSEDALGGRHFGRSSGRKETCRVNPLDFSLVFGRRLAKIPSWTGCRPRWSGHPCEHAEFACCCAPARSRSQPFARWLVSSAHRRELGVFDG